MKVTHRSLDGSVRRIERCRPNSTFGGKPWLAPARRSTLTLTPVSTEPSPTAGVLGVMKVPTMLRRVRSCLIEARPVVQLIFLLRFTAGALLAAAPPGRSAAAHGPAHPARVALGALAWGCATVAVYVFNGLCDRAEDQANGSNRPIARGELPVRSATLACAALAATASALDLAVLGAAATGVTALYLAVGYAYSGPPFPLKRTYYAASIGGGALGALTYLGGALAAGRVTPEVLVFGGMMSLWMGGVGGICKDLSDVAGDRLAGRRTWPVVFGENGARALLVLTAAAVGAFALGTTLLTLRLLACALTVLGGAVAVCAVSAAPEPAAGRPRRRRPYRVFMWTQYASHVVLGGILVAVRF